MDSQQSARFGNDDFSSDSPAVGFISTNPFDDSSSSDDSFFYQECNEDEQQEQESIFSDVTTTTLLNTGVTNHDTYSLGSKRSASTSIRRVAPLSFDVQAVDAKPALNFQSMQRSSHKNDFVSPLETALINRVHYLKSHNNGQESDNDSHENEGEDEVDKTGKDDDSKIDSYFSRLKELTTYFVSSPAATAKDRNQNKCSKNVLSSPESAHLIEKPSMGVSHSIMIQADNGGDEGIRDNNKCSVNSTLAEANGVLHRMDAVKRSLKKNKSKEKAIRFRKKRKVEEDKNILKKIESHTKDSDFAMDHRHAAYPWNRLIILEELGTASSWIILLLPYVAFVLAVLLDARTSFWQSTSGLISTSQLCDARVDGDSLINVPTKFPASPLHDEPCSYKYRLVEGDNILSRYSKNIDSGYLKEMANGVAFTSGPIDVPVLSSFLLGDVNYSSLSSSSVSIVANGSIQFSTIVLQQQFGSTVDSEWFPVSVSQPQKVSMLCEREEEFSSREDTRWGCRSSKSVDVLFALPETSVLTGGSVRVDTILSYNPENENSFGDGKRNQLKNKSSADSDSATSNDFLFDIARSASYQFTSSSEFKAKVLIVVRIGCLLLSIIFTAFWFWSMGIRGFFQIGDCFQFLYRPLYQSEEGTFLKRSKKEVLFYECPWTLFPERRYLLLLLLFLCLLQNPVLLYMHFHPELYSSTRMHVIADSVIGIGLQGVLFIWLCLCQGLRYHTASNARKRADRQKQILELRRATKFLASSARSQYDACASPSDNLASYFDEYGDLHGTTMYNNLKHDPLGDGCADFLLPKIFLCVIGSCTAVVNSLFRFSCSDLEDNCELHGILDLFGEYNEVFVVWSITQLVILSLWALLIIKEALKTGEILKREPFLSTRPVQLSYRILMSILVLGIASFVLPLSLDLVSLLDDWDTTRKAWHRSMFIEGGDELVYKTSETYLVNNRVYSLFDVFSTIILHATRRFPYSGTAASFGPGEMIYVTTATLVLAFIFLPSTSYILHEENQGFLDSISDNAAPKENQRKDKRAVLSMSKYTHTWRAFPLPIERHLNMMNNVKRRVVESYQVDKNFNVLNDDVGRGMIYKSNYVPLFCVETALWLAECSWQTYYSTTEYKTDDFAPGVMNLDTLGLGLEADIYNEKSDTRAFVASNVSSQVDGERDSIIVVAFRGTASSTNLKTDFNWGQEPLRDYFANDQAEYQIDINSSEMSDVEAAYRSKVIRAKPDVAQGKGLMHGADTILRSAPITSLAFPCVHSGFIKAYYLIRNEIMEKVIQVMERQINKVLKRSAYDTKEFVLPKIYVTGHSLGGSLAQLLALDLSLNVEIKLNSMPRRKRRSSAHVRVSSEGVDVRNRTFSEISARPDGLEKSYSAGANHQKKERPTISRRHSFTSEQRANPTESDDILSSRFVHELLSGIDFAGEKDIKVLRPPVAVYTFGQPRVGNHSFSRFYKCHVPHTFRVITEADAITSLPLPTSCPPALYKHAGLEVILDEGSTGNILVGPTVVETLFRFSKVRTSMVAHLLDKYRNGLESAFTQDELQEFYRTHGVNSRSIRSGYNTSDVLPDWVTHISRRNF